MNPIEASSFGLWLKLQRYERHLSQADFAHLVPCARITIQKVEAGHLRPSRDLVIRMAQALDVPNEQWEELANWARKDHGATTLKASPEINELPSKTADRLIGRTNIVTDVSTKINNQETRIITLCGLPGVGKTALAIAIGTGLRSTFRQGIKFISLKTIKDSKFVIPEIIKSFHDILDSNGNELSQAALSLKNQHALIILDGCEHIMDVFSDISYLLKHTKNIVFLLTSRIMPSVFSDQCITVPPLDVPTLSVYENNNQTGVASAVELFIDKIGKINPHLSINEADMQYINKICSYLEGIPLCMEVAANQLRYLSLQTLCATLESHIQIMRAGNPLNFYLDQQIQTSIAWSYELLEPTAQTLLQQLSVFKSGWSLQDIVEVCSEEAWDDERCIDHLEHNLLHVPDRLIHDLHTLVTHNLLALLDHRDGSPQYHMLEMIRVFAHQQLNKTDNEQHMRTRHGYYYMHVAEVTGRNLYGNQQQKLLIKLDRMRANLRAAFYWLLEADIVAASRLAGALGTYYSMRETREEYREWLTMILQHRTELPDRILANILWRWGSFISSPETINILEESAQIYARLDSTQEQAAIYNAIGGAFFNNGELEASNTAYMQALTLAQKAKDIRMMGVASCNLGVVAFLQNQFTVAQTWYTKALRLHRQISDRSGQVVVLVNIGQLAYLEGRLRDAQISLDTAQTLEPEHYRESYIELLITQAWISIANYNEPEAFQNLQNLTKLYLAETNVFYGISDTLLGWSALCVLLGRPDISRKLYGVAQALLACKASIWQIDTEHYHKRIVNDIWSAMGQPQPQSLELILADTQQLQTILSTLHDWQTTEDIIFMPSNTRKLF